MKGVYQKSGLLIKSLVKTIGWTVWNAAFGLGTLFSIFLVRAILLKNSSVNSWLTDKYINDKIIDEGIIMFLCCALMGEVSIDYILSKVDLTKYLLTFILLLSIGSLFLVCLIFSHLFFHPKMGYDYAVLYTIQQYFMIISSFYCITIKTILFYHEK